MTKLENHISNLLLTYLNDKKKMDLVIVCEEKAYMFTSLFLDYIYKRKLMYGEFENMKNFVFSMHGDLMNFCYDYNIAYSFGEETETLPNYFTASFDFLHFIFRRITNKLLPKQDNDEYITYEFLNNIKKSLEREG